MGPIRSLHVNSERGWRGGERQLLLLMTGLARRGHPAALACPPGTPLALQAAGAGLPVHAVPMRGEADLLAILRLRRLYRRENIDVCQLHTPHAHALGTAARGWGGCPVTVVTRRVDFSIHRRGLLGLNRIKYRHGVDRYIAVSDGIRRVLVGDGVEAARVRVVHDGVPPLAAPRDPPGVIRARHGLDERQVVVGCVGHLAGHKGHVHLVRAIGLLRGTHPDLRCLIVGEGEVRPALEAEVARLGLEGTVILTGFQEDVPGYLAAIDLLAVSSVLEGLNTSILDAMLAGVPVVATRTGGIPEVVRHLDTGLLASPGDPPDLARQITAALADRPGAQDRARRARALVESAFTAEAMVEGTLAVYREALGVRG